MYKNHIRRTATNLDVQSFIRRCENAYDERARYVEFVCNVWNEGRFGPDLTDPVIVSWNDRPNLEPVSFLDLEESGHKWLNGPNRSPRFCAHSPLGRADFQAVEAAFLRAKQMGLSAATCGNGNNITTDSSSNQGRGSP